MVTSAALGKEEFLLYTMSPALSSETTVVEQSEEMLWGECTSSGVTHRVGRSLRERRGPSATVDNAPVTRTIIQEHCL